MNEVSVAGGGFNPVSLMPATFGDKYKMAAVLVKSGLIPSGLNTPEKVCVALEWGHELQLSPMVAVNNIAVVNGKPTLSADIMAALVKRSPEYGGVEWKRLDDAAAHCVVTRRGNGFEEKTESLFTYEEAKNAGLTSKDVWKKYPRRMLKHRCLSYALRDAFPDLLAGLYDPDEMDFAPEPPAERNVTPQEVPAADAAPGYGEPLEEPGYAGPDGGEVPEGAADDAPATKAERLAALADVPGGSVGGASPSNAYLTLEALRDEYRVELHGKPYKKITSLLDDGAATDEELAAMYQHTVEWLKKTKRWK